MKVEHCKYNPLISVIVPIYNIQEYLRQCIESIIKQTYDNLEIILVNDGSTDNCGKICNEYAAKDTRIKVLHKENGGLVSARKAGLEQSTGDYIAYVDGDDWIEAEMYSALILAATSSNVDILIAGHKEEIGGQVVEIAFNKPPVGVYKQDKSSKSIFQTMLCTDRFSQFGIYSYLWNKLFKKEAIYKFQMAVDNDISIGEDAAVVYPAILNANSICITENTHYHYRQHTSSMVKSKCKDVLAIKKFNLLYKHLYYYFSNSTHKDILLNQLINFMLSLLTVRTDAFLVESTNHTYPFKIPQKKAKVILCGAGTFGQHLYHRLCNQDILQLVLWVDELAELYQKSALPVENFNKINHAEYDYALVAFINGAVADEVEKKLLDLGVEKQKIRKPFVFEKEKTIQILATLGVGVG